MVSFHTADSKPVKEEVIGTMILPPLAFPDFCHFFYPSAHGGRTRTFSFGMMRRALDHCAATASQASFSAFVARAK